MAIYEHNNQNESLWGKGRYQVMIKTLKSDRPFGYCDGTPEDEASLIATAESEGLEEVEVVRKPLKTGREVWTVTGRGGGEEDEFNADATWED